MQPRSGGAGRGGPNNDIPVAGTTDDGKGGDLFPPPQKKMAASEAKLLFLRPLQISKPSYDSEPGADEASKEEDFVHKRLINHVNLIEKHTKKTLQLLIIRHRLNRTREQTQPRKQENVKASGIQFYY